VDEQPTIGLRFIVLGVPRSGTVPFAHALNLHPEVLCATERFSYRADHSRIVYPESFLETPRLLNAAGRRKANKARSVIARKGTVVRYAGNKSPRYYLTLDKVNAQVPGLRNLLIYRSPYGFIPSWSRREQADAEGRWSKGDIGLFGFLDLIVCLQRVAHRDDVFFFPYERGLNQSPEPVLEALSFIGADPCRYEVDRFVREHLPKKAVNPRRIPLAPHEMRFLERVRAAELDDLISSYCGVVTPELANEIDAYLTAITPLLPGAIDEAFRASGSTTARAYGARYVHLNRQELAGLFAMTRGSDFMAEIQRFGAVKLLHYAYAQRRRIVRRASSLRWVREPAFPP
jgi:hypothetical protein